MGKRIERIFANQFTDKKEYLTDKLITVIFKNGISSRGILSNFMENSFSLKLNTKSTLQISIDQIQEIQIDKITSW